MIHIVIPTLNEAKRLPGLLDDLALNRHLIDQVVVVDGGSTDKTITLAKSYPFVEVIQTKANVAHQRTVGVKACRQSKWTVLLDADVRLFSGQVQAMVREAESKNLAIACPRYMPSQTTLGRRLFYGICNTVFRLTAPITPSGAGSCILVQTALAKEVGYFDERYQFDDIVFIRKAARHKKFRILKQQVDVSDRRFERYGTAKMVIQYGILGILFAVGAFGVANHVEYAFAAYDEG